MVQKAIDEGRLELEEKPIKIDIDLFHIEANYIEPIQIMIVGTLIGSSKVNTSFLKRRLTGL